MEQRPASQKFPAGLAGVLNSPDDNRDSAYFSSTDASSKHTSAASGMGVLSPPSSGFQTSPVDKTPSPTTTANLLPHPHQPLVSPTNSHMSVASMVSPTTPSSAGPQRFDRPQSLESGPNSATFAINGDYADPLSRRESVDSRISAPFHDMRLGNSNSPYASHNPSTTSIHNTLVQQRNPRPGLDNLAVHRISNGYQPSAERKPEGHHPKAERVAPAITGPATGRIARAAEPTKGQAWAFPAEDDLPRLTPGATHSQVGSRRSSIADSLASSQYTTESRLPPGQRRLDEVGGSTEYHRMSAASGEFSTVHHHTLQHRQLGDLRDEETGSANGSSQPYSRTPELRVSHKLAERKRRTEMKELFEHLRDLMPQERGSKASKWEILTKAIHEHQRQAEHIQKLSGVINTQASDIENLKRELQSTRLENERLRGMHSQQQGPPMPEPYHGPSDQYRQRQPELPPLRTLQSPAAPASAPDSMMGVQYEGLARSNGFRPSDGPRY